MRIAPKANRGDSGPPLGDCPINFIGTIESPAGAPPIEFEAWVALIDSRRELVRGEPRRGINPFSGKPTTFQPARDVCTLTVDGSNLGSFSWARDDSNAVCVFGELTSIRDHAVEIANQLGGVFKLADEIDG